VRVGSARRGEGVWAKTPKPSCCSLVSGAPCRMAVWEDAGRWRARENEMAAGGGLRVRQCEAGGGGLGQKLEIEPLGLNFACAVLIPSWKQSRRAVGCSRWDGGGVRQMLKGGGGLLVLTFYLPIPILLPTSFSSPIPLFLLQSFLLDPPLVPPGGLGTGRVRSRSVVVER
jgi:hypothetical protein